MYLRERKHNEYLLVLVLEMFVEVIKQRLQDEKVEKLTENVTQIVFVTSSNLIGVCVREDVGVMLQSQISL